VQGLWYFSTSDFSISSLNCQLSIIHYIITPPRLRRYPSYLKRGVIMGLHHLNSPLKIRGQVLLSGSTGVMIFWGRSQLRVFAPSWQIKVLPFRQVSDDDSCRRINSAVMKIRLFKPKTPSNTEISITVEVFNSPANLCLKGNNLHNRRSPTCGQRHHYHCCLKGRTTAVTQTNIHIGKKRKNKTKIRSLKFLFLYFPFLYFLLILNYPLHHNTPLPSAVPLLS
jgi:hypothetical protein